MRRNDDYRCPGHSSNYNILCFYAKVPGIRANCRCNKAVNGEEVSVYVESKPSSF